MTVHHTSGIFDLRLKVRIYIGFSTAGKIACCTGALTKVIRDLMGVMVSGTPETPSRRCFVGGHRSLLENPTFYQVDLDRAEPSSVQRPLASPEATSFIALDQLG